MTAPNGAVDEEAGWDFDNFQAGPSSSGKQRRAVPSSICDLVSQLGFLVPKSGLDVLKLAEEGLRSRLELVDPHATLTTKKAEVITNLQVINWL